MKRTSILIGIMMLLTVFGSLLVVQNASAADLAVPGTYPTIQEAIQNATAGDTIIVQDGFYVENLLVNKSVTIVSANGSAMCWINGTVNITVDDVTIGGVLTGFTVYQATTTAGTNAIQIGTNGSRDNIDIVFNEIIGGFNGIQIGRFTGGTTDNNTNISITSNTIRDNGGSAIQALNGWPKYGSIYGNQITNTSNVATRAAIKLDGVYDTEILSNTIQDTTTFGGEGINITGLNHPCDIMLIQWNIIYDTDGYSPIIIRSLSDSEYAQNIVIEGNRLTNNTYGLAEPAIRFDNISGMITATNISVVFNNISTTSRDIEERFALTATYDNWTGIMPAYFNQYGPSAGAGTFRDATHLYATPYLISYNAFDGIVPYGTLALSGVDTGTLNNTLDADARTTITSSNDLLAVMYEYPISLLATYPARSMHKYIELGVSDTSHITFPVNITIYYTTADLATRGWSENKINGLVFYNESELEWQAFNDTGVNTTNQWGSYLGYVWGVAYTESQLTGTILGIDYIEIPAEGGGVEEQELDSDGDGLTDTQEAILGTNPNVADTDGDGYSDYEEYMQGSDPLDAASIPISSPLAFVTQNIVYIVLAIIIIAIITILAIILTNKKLRRKYFK
ncbi:MAG: hypothetical protein IMZ53_08370 [Thermoplasmata archaeon]|nr:hypothetical protein [Thermoplasmata archaeon]MBE3140583.1 hypothetical protein [Thermoplasmata archaeon]